MLMLMSLFVGMWVNDIQCSLVKALDSDNSGYLDREEFLNFASNMPVKSREKLLKSLDSDGDGRVDLEEFRQLFNKK